MQRDRGEVGSSSIVKIVSPRVLPTCVPGHPKPGASILFLDIDGVLNKHVSSPSIAWHPEKALLARLKRVVEATDCSIVLTSDWRCKDDLTLDIVLDFKCAGIKHGVLIGRTLISDEITRAAKIEVWLKEHGTSIGERWCALDDLPLEAMDRGHTMRGHVIQCDPGVGLSEEEAGAAIALLQWHSQ